MTSRREAFLKAALPPSHYRTGKTADRRDQHRFTARPGPARRFDRPPGGTEEFLGRRAARRGSCRAQAKRHVGRPPICVWRRQQVWPVAAMTEARGAATREGATRLVGTVRTGSQNQGRSGCALLTVEAIYVFDSSSGCWAAVRQAYAHGLKPRQRHGSSQITHCPAYFPSPPGSVVNSASIMPTLSPVSRR
jgi:hypothetical protein